MTISQTKRLVGVTLAAALLAACTGTAAGPQPTTVEILVDGSSTVFPITEAVAEEFQLANPGVQVPVAFSGTGGGFSKFCRGETDLNDASRPISEEETEACEAAGIEWVELQVAIDGLSVVVSLANDYVTCLSVEQLNQIFGPDSPEEITWADVDPMWPAEKINRFIPGADSGTFDYFTEEISGEAKASTTHATQSEDDNFLVTGLAGDDFSIGYFGYYYASQNTDKIRAIGVDAGEGCIEPTDETINSNEYAPLSRPLFIYPDVNKAKEREELRAFVDFYLANTSALTTEVGYVALPDDLLAAETAEWAAAVGD